MVYLTDKTVPQEMYTGTRSFDALPTITFYENRFPGVRLEHVLNNDLGGLGDSDTKPLLTSTARKITLRINWPGYLPWFDVLHVYDHSYNANPITLHKLAVALTQKIKLCLDDLSRATYNARARDPEWIAENIRIEDLVLMELRHVSAGSWQPVLVHSPRNRS